MNKKTKKFRPRASLAKRHKNTLSKQLKVQLRLIKHLLLPLPKSGLETKIYLKRIASFITSRNGIIIELELLTSLLIILFIVLISSLAFFKQDVNSLGIFAPNLPGSITYYDRTGKIQLWQEYNTLQRVPVTGSKISNYIKEATVAVEDKNFYHEEGFDLGSIIRASLHDIIHHGTSLEGASTITEQLVKLNKGWTDPLTIPEKLEELALSVELNHEFSKNQILTAYLNIAPYGNIDYGVQAAAKDYFHENADQLSLAQASMLASIPQAPTYYSPYNDHKYNSDATVDYFEPKALIDRQHYILHLMLNQHLITKKQEEAASKVNVLAQVHELKSKYNSIKAPYFVLLARQQLINQYGTKILKHGAWKVRTTLNMPLQNLAQEMVMQNLAKIKSYGANQEALVAEQNSTGQVLAVVGGTNFSNTASGQINWADTELNPGATINPYIYTSFINQKSNNAGAGSVLYDIQQPLPDYPCTNKNLPYAGGNCLWDTNLSYPGPVTIRYALGGNRNVPTLKASLEAGLSHIETTAASMIGNKNSLKCISYKNNKLTSQVPCTAKDMVSKGTYLKLDQTVNGLATISRGGQEIPQSYILSITNAANQSIYSWKQPSSTTVINPDTAYIINNILSDPNASNLPGYCNSLNCSLISQGGYKWQHFNGWDIAVSSSNQNTKHSSLMSAWSTPYTVVTWVGQSNNNGPVLTAPRAEILSEPLARGWMEGALQSLKTKPTNWQEPPNINLKAAYVIYNPIDYGAVTPSRALDIYPSWYKANPNIDKKITIDKVSGLLATSCTPSDADEVIYEDGANLFSVDKFYRPPNTIPTTYDNVHKCNDQPPSVVINEPANDICSNQDNNGQGCLIETTIKQGTYSLSSKRFVGNVSFSINNKVIKQFKLSNSSPQTVSFYYLPTSNSLINIKAIVTDSVLYQSSDTISFQAQYSNQPSTATTPSPTNNTNS